MASLVDALMQQLGGGGLKQISGQIGADEQKTQSAVTMALPLIMGALARNSSQGDGAQSLSKALAKDHDGSILDNLAGFLGNPSAGPGDGILRHALGEKRQSVESGLSKATGLDAGSVSKLLVTLAPVVMGMLGRQQREKQIDANGLAGLLNTERQQVERQGSQMGMIGSLLDSDGDGQIEIGEVIQKVSFFSKLFGKG
jgi:hypothetical protein